MHFLLDGLLNPKGNTCEGGTTSLKDSTCVATTIIIKLSQGFALAHAICFALQECHKVGSIEVWVPSAYSCR